MSSRAAGAAVAAAQSRPSVASVHHALELELRIADDVLLSTATVVWKELTLHSVVLKQWVFWNY